MPVRTTTGFLIKHSGLAILYPNMTAQINWTQLCMFTGHIVAALQGRVEFRSVYHTQLLTYSRAEIQQFKVQETEESLSASVGGLSLTERRHLFRGKKTGAWFSIALSTVNETEYRA